MYELEDEEPLAHRILAAVDSNNSLRLGDDSLRKGTQQMDTQTGCADFWLLEDYVNKFEDEVPMICMLPLYAHIWLFSMICDIHVTFEHNGNHIRMCFKPLGIYAMSF